MPGSYLMVVLDQLWELRSRSGAQLKWQQVQGLCRNRELKQGRGRAGHDP